VLVRDYRADDLDQILELSIEAWTPNFESTREVLGDEMFRLQHGEDWREYQRASVRQTLESANAAWVIEEDGAVAGFAVVTMIENEPIGELVMIAVDPAQQRKGLAQQLIDRAEGWLRDAGVPVMMIQTGGDPGHEPARRTYENAGYTLMPAAQYFKAL
jgi:GNAT superfamily N-acetyltransferase